MTELRETTNEPQNVAMDPLADLAALPAEQYANLDLDRLTVFGVKLLVERDLPVTFENVVVALYRLFPEKFSLLGFPQYPDAARVNRALLHCQPKYRNYLTGTARSGYHLTHIGRAAADETEAMLKAGAPPSETKRKRPVPRGVADQFMREITDSDAFAAFQDNRWDDIKYYDVTRILRATPDSPREVLRRNMKQLLGYAKAAGRQDVARFLEWAATTFQILS